jgi:3-deoxy-D-manno-octulosonic-acid transferase
MYTFFIYLYGAVMRLAANFHTKAKDWVVGRRNIWTDIAVLSDEKQANEKRPVFWLHAASLGEFEQGRPILEAWRAKHGDTYKIIVTFFSPSGYNVRKNYPLADVVTYLPLDTPENARRFIKMVKPAVVVFVKYEFWYHILTETFKTNAAVYLVSASFRPNQFLFKWYGASFLGLLHGFRQIFVQKPEHLAILEQNNVKNAVVAGDTRLDRSVQVAEKTPSLPLIAHFIGGKTTLIAGSTWQADENILLPIMQNAQFADWCFIIAPHEIKSENIKALQQRLGAKTVLYSELSANNGADNSKNILIIDNIGLLAALFKYANYAYIGGALGSGLHNIIEAAVFGVPIFFGNKNYKKFPESVVLSNENSAFPIGESHELSEKLLFFTKNNTAYLSACANNKRYVLENAGATEQILAIITKNIS